MIRQRPEVQSINAIALEGAVEIEVNEPVPNRPVADHWGGQFDTVIIHNDAPYLVNSMDFETVPETQLKKAV
jgi:hypothetical protein